MLSVPPPQRAHSDTRGGGAWQDILTRHGIQPSAVTGSTCCASPSRSFQPAQQQQQRLHIPLMLKVLSVQDQACDLKMESRSSCSEKKNERAKKSHKLDGVRVSFKKQSGWVPPQGGGWEEWWGGVGWGGERGALFKNYTLQSVARRWHQQKLCWGSGGVEAATHPLWNQNSLSSPCRLRTSTGRRRERQRRKQPARLQLSQTCF